MLMKHLGLDLRAAEIAGLQWEHTTGRIVAAQPVSEVILRR
jgi:hypothetical protein